MIKHIYSSLTAIACTYLLFSFNVYAEPAADSGDTSSAEPISVLPLEDLRVFTKAFDHIRNAYVEDITDSQLLEYAIRGMIAELDPHSVYLDASQFEDIKEHTTGEFGGLGIEVGMENGFIKVITPMDDTPAAKAGIEAGDLIIKLDETAVKGLDLGEAVELMRGEKGSKLVLTVVREGVDQPFEVTIVRDTIKIRSVRSEIIADDFGYIRIAQFQMKTGPDVKTEFEKLIEKNPSLKGLVLDLRNNPGGVLQASVEVADHFIDEGLIVYTKGRQTETDVEFNATTGDISNELPIVVLVNNGSASASEIVAGALQDQERAIVIGTQSFGKGSVQSIIPITNERAIKITTARYYTPSGRSIQAEGIKPDIEVEQIKVTALKKRFSITESELSGHLKNGDDKGSSKNPNNKEQEENDSTSLQNKDNQLYEAINLLKGIDLFRKAQIDTTKKKTELAKHAPQEQEKIAR